MSNKKHPKALNLDVKSNILDDVRQLRFPSEFRITAPVCALAFIEGPEAEVAREPTIQPPEYTADSGPVENPVSNQLVAELGTCLWYLKTKYFKREWEDNNTDDDPRVRRMLGRLNKGIDALRNSGVEIHDPTNKRYPQGGEAMMRPIEFQPTDGLTFDMVTETVMPIIYRDDRLIQPGEVFVAVPREEKGETLTPIAIAIETDTGEAIMESEPLEVDLNTEEKKPCVNLNKGELSCTGSLSPDEAAAYEQKVLDKKDGMDSEQEHGSQKS